jgi:uncharacterized protein
MIMNDASVKDLNSLLPEGTEPSTSLHFRPNFVVKGDNLKAYEEDKWTWVKIGETIFQVVKPCTRYYIYRVLHKIVFILSVLYTGAC